MVKGWRDLPPTQKQLKYIEYIRDFDTYCVAPPFRGTTRGEACDYISKYAKYAYEDAWAIENGYD